jgi:hypothetical protein
MPSFPLLRTVRPSRWCRRLAVAAVLAGAIAGPLAASPAEAHGNGPHFVTISGWVRTELANGTEHPDTCFDTYTATLTLQRGHKTEDRVDIDKPCFNAKASLILIARLRDDKYVDTEGYIRLKTKTCIIAPLCWTQAEKKDYRAGIPEDFTQRQDGPEFVAINGDQAGFLFSIIVDGPDAPAM